MLVGGVGIVLVDFGMLAGGIGSHCVFGILVGGVGILMGGGILARNMKSLCNWNVIRSS